MSPRIALIHATPLAVAPVQEAFARLWPQASLMSVLDDSLSRDLAAAGRLDEAMVRRFHALADYVLATGAQGIVYTCSAFGDAIESVRAVTRVPVLKPNEAMFRQALRLAAEQGGRVGLITTFAPSAAALKAELLQMAAAQGQHIELMEACAPDAMRRLDAGDAATHDAQVVEAAAGLADCPVLLLGQFSMAHSAAAVRAARPEAQVLTSPDSAVAEIRAQMHDAA